LEVLYEEYRGGTFPQFTLDKIHSLDTLRGNIFLEQEREWCLKIFSLWIEARDQNTKYFKKYANYRKKFNTNSDLNDINGNKPRGLSELVSLGVSHFKEIFREPDHVKIGEILKLIFFFRDSSRKKIKYPYTV
jgi:hypothetical protein